MQLAQSIGLELPLKILVFEDASGKSGFLMTINWLAQPVGCRFNLAPIAAMSTTLAE